MHKSKQNHTVSTIFVLMLAFAFAASILTVLMLGINVYGNIQQNSEEQFHGRVSLSYIATKIRTHDMSDTIRVGEFEDSSAIFIDKEFYDEKFTTIIYTYDGWLRELLTDTESATMDDTWITGCMGMPLLSTDYMSFHMVRPGFLLITSLDMTGERNELFINLSSEAGGDI
jgi:hypothetical protein